MKKHEAVKIVHEAIMAHIEENPTHFKENPELLAELEEANKLMRKLVILPKPVIAEVILNYNDWKLVLKDGVITVTKGAESREYTNIPDVVKVEQENEYVFLTHPDTAFTQIKFEDGNFLVIDLFNFQGDLLNDIGSHVFGED